MKIYPDYADPEDAEEICALIVRCRDAMAESGMEQWPEFYPDIDVVREDIEWRKLHIYREAGAAVAVMTIDNVQPEPYSDIEWKYGERYVCVHRLAVDPSRQREGIAAAMMSFAELYATLGHSYSVRLDTYSLNAAANSFYEKIGYEKRGTIQLPKKPDRYNCYEKALMPAALQSFVKKSRSVRRFKESEPVSREKLQLLVKLARLAPSGGNKQPLKFILSHEIERNAIIFPHLAWAGYIKDWDGPAEGERPAAYIVILGDTEISRTFGCDHGIAAQVMMLGAAMWELGACIIGSVDRKGLAAALGLSERYEILLVLALGEPAETVLLEDVTEETGIKYWRSADGVHHVPKRSLADLIIEP